MNQPHNDKKSTQELTPLDFAIFDEIQNHLCPKILWDRLEGEACRPPTVGEFLDRLEWLVMNHYLHAANGKAFDRAVIEAEFSEATLYWLGLTDAGFLAWLRKAKPWQRAIYGIELIPEDEEARESRE